MKKKLILTGILICLLTACVGCMGGGQASSSPQKPPASESSVEVSSEETSDSSAENSVDSSVENSTDSEDSSSNTTPEIEYCTVQFDTDGGSEVEPMQAKAGEKITKPEDPQKSSKDAEYEFIGWYNGETEWDFEKDTVTENMVLTAKWEKKESYTPPFLPKD